MKLRSVLAVLTLLVCLPAVHLAQEGSQEAPSPEEMMEAMMKLAAPGEHHEHLAMIAGDWTYNLKMWMPGSPEATESAGTVTSKWILGGRFLQSEMKGEFMGMPFHGIATDGYDTVNKQYISTWKDNMGTFMMHYSGQCNGSGKVRTMRSEFTDPMSGQKMKNRAITTVLTDDSYKYESFMVLPDENEFKNMEVVATRR